MKRLSIKGNYFKGGKEGTSLWLALTTAKHMQKAPALGAKLHTSADPRGHKKGACRGKERVACCRGGSSPPWVLLSPPAHHTFAGHFLTFSCSPINWYQDPKIFAREYQEHQDTAQPKIKVFQGTPRTSAEPDRLSKLLHACKASSPGVVCLFNAGL